jgi:hypothetical protein
VRDGVGQRSDGDDGDPFNGRGLPRVRGRQHDLVETPLPRRERDAEGALDRSDLAVETELADEDPAPAVREGESRDLQEGDRDRKIERRADFPEPGGREVDGDDTGRQGEAAVPERGTDPLARFPDARVRKTDDRERRKARRDVDLHVENAGVDPDRRGGVDAGEHLPLSVAGLVIAASQRGIRALGRAGLAS